MVNHGSLVMDALVRDQHRSLRREGGVGGTRSDLVSGDNLNALERTIGALEGLTSEHDALVEHARTLAREIDTGDSSDSKTHGEYRQVLKMLLEVGKKPDLDAFGEILKLIKGED